MGNALVLVASMRKTAVAALAGLAGLLLQLAPLAALLLHWTPEQIAQVQTAANGLTALAGLLGGMVIHGISTEDAALKTTLPAPAAPLPMVAAQVREAKK